MKGTPVKHLRYLVFLAVLLLALSACSTIPLPKKAAEPVKVLQYTQLCGNTPCTQFVLTLFSNRMSTYQGKAYTPLMGVYARQLSENEWNVITKLTEEANLWSVPESYPAPSVYYPISEITVFENEYSKRLIGQEFPFEIKRLELQLQNLANPGLQGWKQLAQHTYDIPEGVYPNLLKVQLKPEINFDFWAGKYFESGLSRVQMLQEASNFWLVRFDPSRTPPNLMKERLEADSEVLKVDYHPIPKRK